MSSWTWKAGLAGAAVVAATVYAVAQMAPGHGGMHDRMGAGGGMHERMMQMMQGGMRNGTMPKGPGMHGGISGHGMMGQHGGPLGRTGMTGQDAFGAIQGAGSSPVGVAAY